MSGGRGERGACWRMRGVVFAESNLEGRTEGREIQLPPVTTLAGKLREALESERPCFFLWAPIFLGSGIALYFALLREPGLLTATAPLIVCLILLAAISRGTLAAAVVTGLVLAGTGFLAAKLRVEYVSAPVLAKQMTNVEVVGRIERIEPKTPRGERLAIAVERLGSLEADRTPQRVRVRTMQSNATRQQPLAAGMRVSLKATLSPPAKPPIPGGFDFARAAFFERLGGVGYTFSPVTVLPHEGAPGWSMVYNQMIEDVRTVINARIKAALPNESGAIAAALITGERGGISDATNSAYRNAGLFHILSISGLHMVIMAGAVFYCVRLLLAAIPAFALRFSIKKWAAAAGIAGALLYLAISGGAFATVRSAVQIVIMFVAILLDRPALALRNVALAAFLILAVYPESLFDPGFQMSFAAVAALIAGYEEVRRRYSDPTQPHPVLRIFMFFGGIVLSTLIASVAVAPFAAYHFHQSQQYAVLANLVAIPVCNFIVMPAALGALVLMPLGLEGIALFVMGKGIDAMTWCAGIVAKLPGAVGHVRAIPEMSFVMLVLGGLWLLLWQARWRIAGAAVAFAGLLLAPSLPRPDALVARGGELVAVRGADGVLSALPAKRAKYELERWLEHDGDPRTAPDAAKATAFKCDSAGCVARVKGVALSVLRHPAALADDCAAAGILILNVPRPKRGCEHPAKIIDVFDIWREGTHALYVEPSANAGSPNLRIETVAQVRGERPWAPVPRRSQTAGSDGTATAKVKVAKSGPIPPDDILSSGLPRPDVEDDDDYAQTDSDTETQSPATPAGAMSGANVSPPASDAAPETLEPAGEDTPAPP